MYVLQVQGTSAIDRALPSFSCPSLYPIPPHLTPKMCIVFLTIFLSLSFFKLMPYTDTHFLFSVWRDSEEIRWATLSRAMS